jgi:hypothetical protein
VGEWKNNAQSEEGVPVNKNGKVVFQGCWINGVFVCACFHHSLYIILISLFFSFLMFLFIAFFFVFYTSYIYMFHNTFFFGCFSFSLFSFIVTAGVGQEKS